MTSPAQEPVAGPASGRFTSVRLREGYDRAEVDTFVDRAVHALAAPVPTLAPDDVRTVTFTPVRLREGYDMAEVDGYLDDLERQLADRWRAAGLVPDAEPAPGTSPARRAVRTWLSRLTTAALLAAMLVWLASQVLAGR
jgi:DivIVA domain-containing protein